MTSQDDGMSVDTRNILGPSNEERADVDRLLTYLHDWVDIPNLCRQHGVQEAGQIPVASLRVLHARKEENRLQFSECTSLNNIYARSDRQEEQELNKPAYRGEVRLYLGPEDKERQPLTLAQVTESAQTQKAIMNSIDRLKLKITRDWAQAEAADDNLDVFKEEAASAIWGTEDGAKIFTQYKDEG